MVNRLVSQVLLRPTCTCVYTIDVLGRWASVWISFKARVLVCSGQRVYVRRPASLVDICKHIEIIKYTKRKVRGLSQENNILFLATVIKVKWLDVKIYSNILMYY